MEQDEKQVEQHSSSPEVTTSTASGASSYDIVVRQVSAEQTGEAYKQREPIVQALQELLDVPRQILPEQTYTHLKNAAREAALAVVSLVNNYSGASRGSGGKTIRRIDVD